MKHLILFLTLIFTASSASAQTIWTVDFTKSKNGQQANYLKFIELNWATARQTLKEKGDVVSYRVLSLPENKSLEWDVLLLTEYADRATWERREAIFAEVFKRYPTTPVNGETSGRKFADIKFDRVFTAPITSEISRIMLDSQINNAEIAAARVPLENYLKGHETGKKEFMRRAFHTEGKLIFMRDGKFATLTFDEYIAGMKEKPADDEANRRRKIESVEIIGDAGIAKIVLDYPTVKFTDYMSLLKINGEWKIVNKSFHAERKEIKN